MTAERAYELAGWLDSMKPIGVFNSADGITAKSEIADALRKYSTLVKRIRSERDELSITMRHAEKNGWNDLKERVKMRLDLLDSIENGKIVQEELC